MTIHEISGALKRALPPNMFSPIRKMGTALITPILFSYHSGHFLSCLKSRSVDREGQPVCWYTYPAIDFLAQKDFGDKTILEWGAGQSTLWWARRAKEVFALEEDARWHEYVRKQMPPNVSLQLASGSEASLDAFLVGRKFDVIVIDNLDREGALRKSSTLLTRGGTIILDNSDHYWGVVHMLRKLEFSRIDFYGWAPGLIRPHCTSLFFKRECFLFSGSDNPARNRIGA